MQGRIYLRCFRAGELFHKAETMILNYIPSLPLKPTTYLHHHYRFPTRHLSTIKPNPWDSSRTTSTGFRQIKAFISDSPAKNTDGMPNGYAMFSTSSSDDGGPKKPVVKKEETEAAAEADQISNARIISTLAKYLWMKDNFEFRFRVIAALSLLVGAKHRDPLTLPRRLRKMLVSQPPVPPRLRQVLGFGPWEPRLLL